MFFIKLLKYLNPYLFNGLCNLRAIEIIIELECAANQILFW